MLLGPERCSVLPNVILIGLQGCKMGQMELIVLHLSQPKDKISIHSHPRSQHFCWSCISCLVCHQPKGVLQEGPAKTLANKHCRCKELVWIPWETKAVLKAEVYWQLLNRKKYIKLRKFQTWRWSQDGKQLETCAVYHVHLLCFDSSMDICWWSLLETVGWMDSCYEPVHLLLYFNGLNIYRT